MTDNKNLLIIAAKDYLGKGWRVIPTHKKHPCVDYVELGLHLKHTDQKDFSETFMKLFEDHPEATGIALIIDEDICVLDLDSTEAEAEFELFMSGLGIKTARGSKWLFSHPIRYDEIDLPITLKSEAGSAKFHISPKAELILGGMLCELPPGLHKDGKIRYEWKGDPFAKLPLLPKELYEKAIEYGKYRKENGGFAPGEFEEILNGLSEGEGRNEAAYRLTCHFIGKKEDWESITLKIEGWNRRNNPPLSKQELNGILKSAKKMYDKNQDEQKESSVDEISLADLKKLQTDLNNRRLPDLSKYLPADHYLNLVTTWMTGLSDTYYEYQVCAGLWGLSALLQGKGALQLKQNKLHPNLYVILLGMSTKSRKSTAVKKIASIFTAATEIELYNDDPTIEGYFESLAMNPVQNFVRDEVSGLLAKYHKKYNDGIFDLECNIYDCADARKTKAAGREKTPQEFTIKNPYVTHLYATTPEKFSNVMTLEDFSCGYGYRLLYAFPTYEKPRKGIELEDEENIAAWALVLQATKTLHRKYSTMQPFDFTITSEALSVYNEIIAELEDVGATIGNDHIDSAIGRAQEHILKIAMLLEVGKSNPSHEITLESINIASLMVIDFFIPSFVQTVDRIMSDIKTNKIEKAIKVIRGMGGNCTRSTLIKNGHFTKKECDEIVEAMVLGGILLEKQIKETKTITYVLNTESKAIEIKSSKLSKMFHQFRTFRTFRSFAIDTNNLAKSAKSKEINKDINENQTLDNVESIDSLCETAKSAKSANPAKIPEISIKQKFLVTAKEMFDEWKNEGVV